MSETQPPTQKEHHPELNLESEATVKTVRRLPLLFVSRSLQRDGAGIGGPEFLVGWNNVVIERTTRGDRAEGFASLLSTGDEMAVEVFGDFGYDLDLFPPLVESVLRNGGYRCSSQHVR